jgi:hypothetical protein
VTAEIAIRPATTIARCKRVPPQECDGPSPFVPAPVVWALTFGAVVHARESTTI